MDHESWIMNHGSWIMDHESWIMDHGYPIAFNVKLFNVSAGHKILTKFNMSS